VSKTKGTYGITNQIRRGNFRLDVCRGTKSVKNASRDVVNFNQDAGEEGGQKNRGVKRGRPKETAEKGSGVGSIYSAQSLGEVVSNSSFWRRSGAGKV